MSKDAQRKSPTAVTSESQLEHTDPPTGHTNCMRHAAREDGHELEDWIRAEEEIGEMKVRHHRGLVTDPSKENRQRRDMNI